MQQKDALTVLLTGRGETNFAELVNRILKSKSLDFDLVVLKPEVGPNNQRFQHTMDFKQEFLRDLIFTYKTADELRIYEDRPKHTKGFREFSEKLNKSLLSHPIDQPPPLRKPIITEVIQVADLGAYLDPTTECAAIQRIINRHNIAVTNNEPNLTRSPSPRMQIKKNFIYFGYLINATDSARLLALANIQPLTLIDSGEIRLMASSILISPRPASRSILHQVGGIGKKVTWQVTGTSVFEGRIWAARVAPVPETEKHYTNDQTPFVVLALRQGTRAIDAGRIQNWQPVPPEKAFIFETVVGDKVFLEVVPENRAEEDFGYRGRNGAMQNTNRGNFKRKYGDDNGYKAKEDLARSGSRNGERDDGTWAPKDGNGYDSYAGAARQGAGGDRHGQGRYFNQMQGQHEGRNFSGNRGGGSSNRGGRGGGDTRRGNHQNYGGGGGNGRGGSRANDRGRGGGGGKGRGGGNRNGPAGYKSLDDYGSGPGGYDGTGDFGSRGAGAGGGDVVMNY